MALSYYVDSTAGSDSNNGLSPSSPFKTFQQLEAVLRDGDTVNLLRGDIWHESLNIAQNNITVQPYGDGANPLIAGDNVRNCIWVSGSNAYIDHIDGVAGYSGVIIQGVGASASVVGGTYDKCGVGIGVGGGGTLGLGVNGHGLGPAEYGQLILADGVTCKNSTKLLAAGDGIQIGEDATNATSIIRNCTLTNNDETGLNVKSGTAIVENCKLVDNGWTGYTAQNNCDALHISGSLIEGNSAAGNGTAQVSIEDHAKVYSTNNIYKDPHNDGVNYTLQIRMVAQDSPTSWYEQGAELHSSYDTFINNNAQTRTLGSIGAYTTDHAGFVLDVQHDFFEHASGSGIAVDAYGSTALKLNLQNNVFDMMDTRAVRVDPGAVQAALIDYNSYYRSDGGTIFEVQSKSYYSESQLSDLFAQYSFEGHGVALTAEPDLTSWLAAKAGQTEQGPTDIALANSSVSENSAGAIIGEVSVTDPDGDITFGFTLSDSRFAVIGSDGGYQLKLIDGLALDYESEPSVGLDITATDAAGLSHTTNFKITVVDLPGAIITGSAGSDVIDATHTAYRQSLPGSEGDTIHGGKGNDIIHGLGGNDVIYGDSGNDIIYGDAGGDRLSGGSGSDDLQGGDGDDILVVTGTEDQYDKLSGGSGSDTLLVSGTGSVTLIGFNAASSSIESWQGNGQALLGTKSADTFDFSGITSVSGLKYVDAGAGNDVVIGTKFNDDLRGGFGNDHVVGGFGDDVLSGGGGNDVFAFAPGSGRDIIRDFAASGRDADIIEMNKSVFANFAEVMRAAYQVGNDVVIAPTSEDSITLVGVALSHLSVDDFRFA